MERMIQLEAIYREGVLQPLEPLELAEDQQVVITVYLPEGTSSEVTLQAWTQVYSGMTEEDIRQVETIALDRSDFSRDPRVDDAGLSP